MNKLATVENFPTAFNPHAPLGQRTEAWIVDLYIKAKNLVEIEYAGDGPELAPWKLLTKEERKLDAVEGLDGEKRDWNIQFQNIIDEKALEVADGLTEAIKAAIANIITSRRRKRLRWQKLKGYESVKKVARDTIERPDSSTGRQLSSFIENQLDDVEAAGISEETTLQLLSRPDKFILNASRAISRTKRDEELTEEEKTERIGDIVEFAAETDRASNIRREYINGQTMQIQRDVVKMGDVTLVTFWCEDEQQFSTLDRKTETVSVEWRKAQPMLSETENKRARHQTLFDLGIILGILQSGEYTVDEISTYLECSPVDILMTLKNNGIVEHQISGKYRLVQNT